MKGSAKLLTAMLLATACSGAGERENTATAGDTLTRAQRDSIIGASSLPGAGVVRRGLEVRDSAAARAAELDSALSH